MVTPLPDRLFFQGIIQMAAAFVHLMRREYPGIIKLLDGAIDKLDEFNPQHRGVDVASLVGDLRRSRDEIAILGPEHFLEWDQLGIPNVLVHKPKRANRS